MAKRLFACALWEMVYEDRQLPLPGEYSGLCVLLAVVSAHSGQCSADQGLEMPASCLWAVCLGHLGQNNILGHRLSQVFQKHWAVRP